MDPLSVIGGVVAIASCGRAVAKCARALHNISRKAGPLAKEIEYFADDVGVFATTISHAHCIIRDHYTKDKTSTAIEMLRKSSALQSLVRQCEWTMDQVKELKRGVHNKSRTLRNLWVRIKWFLDQVKRKNISLSMDKLRISFSLIIGQIHYESLEQRALNPSPLERELYDFKKEIKECRRELQSQMKHIHTLQKRQESLDTRDTYYNGEHDAEIDEIQDFLCHSAKVVVQQASERERTMEPERPSSRHSERSLMSESERAPRRSVTTHSSRSSITSNEVDNWEEGHIRDAGNSSVAGSSLLSSQGYSSNESLGFVPPIQHFEIHPPAIPREEVFPPVPESPSSSSVSFGGRIRDEVQLEEKSQLEEGDYSAVQPFDPILYLDPNVDIVVDEGYINLNSKPAKAILHSKFPQNVISERYAAAHGLTVRYFLPDDDNESNSDALDVNIEEGIDFGDGELRPVIGKTSFNWKISQHEADSKRFRPLTVRCLVTRTVPLIDCPLVLGKSFIDKRRHYWER